MDNRLQELRETEARIEETAAEIVADVRSGAQMWKLQIDLNFLRALVESWDRQRYYAARPELVQPRGGSEP